MDKKAIASDWAWKIALGLVVVGVPFLLTRISGLFDIRTPDLIKNLTFAGGGVGFTLAGAFVLREVWRFIHEKFTSKPPSENHTLQR